MKHQTVMIKNFSRIAKIVQVSAMKVHFQIAERSLFYLNPDIHLRRMTYLPERDISAGAGASGNYGNIPKNAHKISSRYTTGGQKVLLMIYSLYDEIHPNKNRPNAFIYNARTHNIFKYDVFNPRIGAIKISNSLQLQRILR